MNWWMIPTVLLVASSIIGIVCALVWNSPYLTIPPAIGLLSAFCILYLVQEAPNLKTFTQSNTELKQQVGSLTDEVDRLQKINKQEEEKLKIAHDKIQLLLQGTADNIDKQREVLTCAIEALNTLKDSAMKEQAAALQQVLKKVQDFISMNANTALSHLKTIADERLALQKDRSDAEQQRALVTADLKRMTKEVSELEKQANALKRHTQNHADNNKDQHALILLVVNFLKEKHIDPQKANIEEIEKRLLERSNEQTEAAGQDSLRKTNVHGVLSN